MKEGFRCLLSALAHTSSVVSAPPMSCMLAAEPDDADAKPLAVDREAQSRLPNRRLLRLHV